MSEEFPGIEAEVEQYLSTLGEVVTVSIPQQVSTRRRGEGALHHYRTADITPEQIQWLWHPYIPLGKITMLEGDPGMGKSWITCAIAAALSRGERFPGQTVDRPPMRVLMMTGEDGPADTLVPRLKAIGADLNKVYVSDEIVTLDKAGIKKIELAIMAIDARVVIIDPLVSYLGGKMDINKANEVRELVGALAQVALKHGCAVIAVRHMRKAGGAKAIYRGLGSIDFTAAARSALQVDTDDYGKRLVRHVKSNLAEMGPPIYYTVEQGRFKWGEIGEREAPGRVGKMHRMLDDARAFLREELKEGPLLMTALMARAKDEKFSESTLNKAKKGIAESVKEGQVWKWQLLREELTHVDPRDGGDTGRSAVSSGPVGARKAQPLAGRPLSGQIAGAMGPVQAELDPLLRLGRGPAPVGPGMGPEQAKLPEYLLREARDRLRR